MVDGHSGCLIPVNSRSATGPFRVVRRSSAAVDRVTGGAVAAHLTTCVQFAPASGLWCAAQFSNSMTYAVWGPRLQTAFRLLADSGLGGMRSRGFGRARTPDFQPGQLSELLFGEEQPAVEGRGWWVLSLFSPAESDSVDWGAGDYLLTQRSGRVSSPDGAGAEKLTSRMVVEGSVLVSKQALRGSVRDVAPAGCPHPVYRAGYALALPIPWPVSA
jgi:CRISPR type III-A-associated RAMP protein Csm4